MRVELVCSCGAKIGISYGLLGRHVVEGEAAKKLLDEWRQDHKGCRGKF